MSAAFAYIAVLAGRPDNAPPPAAAGAAFGRLAHPLDALDDLADDRRRGRWNPVDATGAGVEATTALARHQVAALAAALPRVVLPDPAGVDARLAHRLLVHETDRALTRTHARTEQPPTAQPPQPGDPGRVRPPRGFVAGCSAAAGAVLHRPALLRRPDHRTVERPAAPQPLRELLRLLVVQL